MKIRLGVMGALRGLGQPLGAARADQMDEHVVKARLLDREIVEASAGIDAELEDVAGRDAGAERDFDIAVGAVARHRAEALEAVGRQRGVASEPDPRRQQGAGARDGAVEYLAAAGQENDVIAEPLGMLHDMGREQDGRAAAP